MKITRLFANEQDKSHFEDLEETFTKVDFAPLMNPVEVSEPKGATQVVFLLFPPGSKGVSHPTPTRQICVDLSGEVKGALSERQSRNFNPGDVVLMEDAAGRGHRVEAPGWNDGYLAMTQRV